MHFCVPSFTICHGKKLKPLHIFLPQLTRTLKTKKREIDLQGILLQHENEYTFALLQKLPNLLYLLMYITCYQIYVSL